MAVQTLIQSYNGGKRRNFVTCDISDADLTTIAAILPLGYSVRTEAVAPAGTAVAKPDTGYTKAKVSCRKKIGDRSYSKPSYVNIDFGKAELDQDKLYALAGVVEDGNGVLSDMASPFYYREV